MDVGMRLAPSETSVAHCTHLRVRQKGVVVRVNAHDSIEETVREGQCHGIRLERNDLTVGEAALLEKRMLSEGSLQRSAA